MNRFALLAVVGLAFSALPATAQISIYGLGGPAIPTGDDLEDVESGLQLTGGATFGLSERLALFAEGQWGTHGIEDSDTKVKPSALMGGLLFRLSSDPDAAISPFFGAGVGIQTVSVDNDTTDPSSSTFGYEVGAGFGFDLVGLPANLMAKYQAASFDADSDIGELDFSIFSILLGFSFPLGGS